MAAVASCVVDARRTATLPRTRDAELGSVAPADARPVRVVEVVAGSGAIRDPDAITVRDDRWTVLEAPPGDTQIAPRDSAPQLVVDFGREVARQAELRIGGGSVGRIELTLGESRTELDLARDGEEFPRRFEFDAAAGEQWRAPVMGLRFARVRVWSPDERRALVALDVLQGTGGVVVGPPSVPWIGEFSCSDSGITRSWQAGVETARLCLSADAEPLVLDGAKRDRAVWAADVAIAARALYASSDDRTPVARSLERLAELRRDGTAGRQPVAATDHAGGTLELVEYGGWWLSAVRDLWRETGDDAFVARLFPKILAQAAWTLGRIEADGFIHKRADELEWCYSLGRNGALAYVNAVASDGLAAAAELARALGESGHAAEWELASIRMRGAVLSRLWDPVAGRFATSLDDRDRFSLDANVLPLWLDWLPEEDVDRVLAAIQHRLWRPWGPLNVDRAHPHASGPEHAGRVWPFLAYFEADSRLRPGRDPERGFELLRRTWGHMLAHEPGNTFWEWIGPDGNPELPRTSLAHAWSVGVTTVLSERVLGIRAVAPRTFEVAPVLGALTHVAGVRPTAWGPIRVTGRHESRSGRLDLAVEMPAGTSVSRFLLPAPESARVRLGGRELGIATETARAVELPVVVERKRGYLVIEAPPALEYRFEIRPAAGGTPDSGGPEPEREAKDASAPSMGWMRVGAGRESSTNGDERAKAATVSRSAAC